MQPEQKTGQKKTSVYFWGFLFRDKKQSVPKQISELNKQLITKVSSGGFYFLASNIQGKLWGWGCSKYNRFGLPDPDDIKAPRLIPLEVKVDKISAGNWHSLFIDTQGSLYGVGHNKYGCLGLGNFTNVESYTKIPLNYRTKKVSAGDGFSIIISENNQLYGCGYRSFHGDKSKQHLNTFKILNKQTKFKFIACGFTHSLAISESGQTYSWGQGNFHQLGNNKKEDIKTPTLIQSISNVKMKHASCTRGEKYAHSMAVSEDGDVYTWGAGYKGKLGHFNQWSHADPADQPIPKKIKSIEFQAEKVLAGGIHSGIIDDKGSIYTFGCGSDGRIGHPESTDHRYLYREGLPRRIDFPKEISVIDASFSYYQNICLVQIEN